MSPIGRYLLAAVVFLTVGMIVFQWFDNLHRRDQRRLARWFVLCRLENLSIQRGKRWVAGSEIRDWLEPWCIYGFKIDDLLKPELKSGRVLRRRAAETAREDGGPSSWAYRWEAGA